MHPPRHQANRHQAQRPVMPQHAVAQHLQPLAAVPTPMCACVSTAKHGGTGHKGRVVLMFQLLTERELFSM